MKGQHVFNPAVLLKSGTCNDILINVVHVLACNENSSNLWSQTEVHFTQRHSSHLMGGSAGSPVRSALRA